MEYHNISQLLHMMHIGVLKSLVRYVFVFLIYGCIFSINASEICFGYRFFHYFFRMISSAFVRKVPANIALSCRWYLFSNISTRKSKFPLHKHEHSQCTMLNDRILLFCKYAATTRNGQISSYNLRYQCDKNCAEHINMAWVFVYVWVVKVCRRFCVCLDD